MEELFTVKEVISGDTITVIPDWKWKKKERKRSQYIRL